MSMEACYLSLCFSVAALDIRLEQLRTIVVLLSPYYHNRQHSGGEQANGGLATSPQAKTQIDANGRVTYHCRIIDGCVSTPPKRYPRPPCWGDIEPLCRHYIKGSSFPLTVVVETLVCLKHFLEGHATLVAPCPGERCAGQGLSPQRSGGLGVPCHGQTLPARRVSSEAIGVAARVFV